MNEPVFNAINTLAHKMSAKLASQIAGRVADMELDNVSHYLLYRVLGVDQAEGQLIDVYQNKGRFLYKYAGTFLEEAAVICMLNKYPDAQRKVRIPNTIGSRPANFEIDFLVGENAFEIKWRDATTDGDHISKEHTRAKTIKDFGYKPIRIMFYYPNRTQAIRIQETIKTIYKAMDGECYFADDAWLFVHDYTGVDLLAILNRIARERTEAHNA